MVPGNCISGYKYVSQSGPRSALGSHSGMRYAQAVRHARGGGARGARLRSLGVEGSKTEAEGEGAHENPTLAMPIGRRQKLSE